MKGIHSKQKIRYKASFKPQAIFSIHQFSTISLIFQLAKSGVDLTMIVLPPDITTSLTVFGSNDAINNSLRFEEVAINFIQIY